MRLFSKGSLILGLSFLSLGSAFASETCDTCPPPPTANDPFDPGSCVGNTLTQKQAADLFCHGDALVKLGKYAYAVRLRKCNQFTGCSNWKTVDTDSILRYTGAGTSGYEQAPKGMTGDLSLKTTSSGIFMEFASAEGSFNLRHISTYLSSSDTCSMYISGQTQEVGYVGVYNAGNAGHGGIAIAQFRDGNQFQLTEHCARFTVGTTTYADSTGSWDEYQVGGLVRY